MIEKKIIFIISNIGLPRCINRVEEFAERGYEIEVYYFDRPSFKLGNRTSNVPMHNVGSLGVGKASYFRRIFKQRDVISNIIRKYDSKHTIFYLFGFDMALLYRYCFSKTPYIFEESDLRHTYLRPNLLVNMMECIDKKIIRKSYLTVFTSEGFIKYHFPKKSPQNIVVVPNRLSPKIKKCQLFQPHITNMDDLKIGFVGAPRFKSVRNFVKVFCENFKDGEFHFYGAPISPELEDLKGYANCFFHGTFNNPADLPEIYSNIDLVLSTYDAFKPNVRYAEPNKLYESIYFEVPIIVSSNTFLADKVSELGVGYSVNAMNEIEVLTFLKGLSLKNIVQKKNNMKTIDKSELISSNDNLFKYIEKQ